jgi:hypothetical protein
VTADLRDKIAAALEAADEHWCSRMEGTDHRALGDALLPLFAAERAAGMRDGADWLTAEYTGPGIDAPIRRAADRLRARADATGEQA